MNRNDVINLINSTPLGERVNLRGADLKGADLEDADLQGALGVRR